MSLARAAYAWLLLCGTAIAGPPKAVDAPSVPLSGADLSNFTSIPTGATTARTFAARAADRINVRDFGATGNARRSTAPVTLAVGSSALSSSASLFTSADVGKTIVVAGAGASGAALVTTIQGYTSPTAVTLAAPGQTLPPTTATAGVYLLAWGNDDTSAFTNAISAANARMALGSSPCIYASGGNYLLSSAPGAFGQGLPGCVLGDGPDHTNFWLSPAFSGDLFSWSEDWLPNSSGPLARSFRIDGWLGASGQQNALRLYDRNDNVNFSDLDVWNMPGQAIRSGIAKNTAYGFLRESRFAGIRIFNSGLSGQPAWEFNNLTGGGDATNDIQVTSYRIFGSNGPSLVVRNGGSTPMGGMTFTDGIVEGAENGTTAADLVTIGDATLAGQVSNVTFRNLSLIDPYTGYPSLRLTASSAAVAPQFVTVDGSIGGGLANGKGLEVDFAQVSNRFHFSNIQTNGTEVTVGSSAAVSGQIFLDGDGHESAWTYAVDATTANLIMSGGGVRQGVPNASPAVVANIHTSSPSSGNPPGAGAVDLQQTRFAATQTATGANASIGGGGNNTAGGQFAAVGGGNANNNNGFVGTIAGGNSNTITGGNFPAIGGGQSNTLSGYGSAVPGGQYATDRGRYNWLGFASGKTNVAGDAQTGWQVLRGTSTSAVRLTADGATAGSANVGNIPDATAYNVEIRLSAIDRTTPANKLAWTLPLGLLGRATGAASVTFSPGTAVTASTGTGSAATVSATADTTNGGLNLTFTPPAGSDTWDVVAEVHAVEAQ